MISLIITSYHADEEMIKLTEQCLNSLTYGQPDEVILVDDASPICKRFTEPDLQIFRNQNGGFPKASNTGWQAAKGDILILSNNDVQFTVGWLEAILKPLEEGYDISHLLVSDADGWDTEDGITEGDKYGSLWAQTRKVYNKLGGFDERFKKGTHEDLDHRRRALNAGFKIGKNHSVVVEHQGRATMNKVYSGNEDFSEGRQIFIDKWGFIE